ncbi:LysR family transcriptional regulator (plasmid) [Paracoccus methylovorus]|uniref:LysR family transcriptional regulator n=1 Tax=Paracoccus methylovorus TaxID=2812658 RepID=A0ABX7JLT6_9RHOB|nr:LysR family transcriptional regulator [Paracoccus methylovorus]QRZ14476.1 LysR family transcriptional regulator [Paracoccus methylovorus]
MDINQARTFLEVVHSGSFIAAADRLNITQTAVSARIRTLEESLGRRLFIRNKAGARLTPAGERLVRHAAAMLQLWERARQQVALPPGRSGGVHLGGELSLWHPLLADWLIWMRRECPDIALQAEVDNPANLMARVQDGSMDVAVLYNPPHAPNLVNELLAEEKLVLVTSTPDRRFHPEEFVFVDWGPYFAASFAASFPELGSPPVSISLGPLALTYLLSVGGCGYFRMGIVRPFLTDGRLALVPGAPEFSHSTHMVYAERIEDTVLDRVRIGLKSVAAATVNLQQTTEISAR